MTTMRFRKPALEQDAHEMTHLLTATAAGIQKHVHFDSVLPSFDGKELHLGYSATVDLIPESAARAELDVKILRRGFPRSVLDEHGDVLVPPWKE